MMLSMSAVAEHPLAHGEQSCLQSMPVKYRPSIALTIAIAAEPLLVPIEGYSET